MNTKKTSSYSDKKSNTENKGEKKGVGRGKKYEKKEKSENSKPSPTDFNKSKELERKGRKKTEDKEEVVKDKTSFDPYYNQQARKHKITCFVCKKEKMVAVKQIDGVPLICDDCIVELEARKLLDVGGMLKTKKLKCQWCDADFYGLNESYLFCDACYDKFSHTIKATGRGFVAFKCKICGADGWIHPKVLADKKRNDDTPVCRTCMEKEESNKIKENSKKRIENVKNRTKKEE